MPSLTIKGVQANRAVVSLYVGPSAPRAEALATAGRPPVYPIEVSALIDTGAALTCIEPSIAADLNLPMTGERYVHTASSGDEPLPSATYDVQLYLPWMPPLVIASQLPVVALDLRHLGVRMLLGRDVLSRGLLIYNGPEDQLTLAY
jgi:hypothetical protein